MLCSFIAEAHKFFENTSFFLFNIFYKILFDFYHQKEVSALALMENGLHLLFCMGVDYNCNVLCDPLQHLPYLYVPPLFWNFYTLGIYISSFAERLYHKQSTSRNTKTNRNRYIEMMRLTKRVECRMYVCPSVCPSVCLSRYGMTYF